MPILPLMLAANAALPAPEADSLKHFDIEEAVVVATPKETQQLRQQALSVSLFDARHMEARRATSLKGLSAYAPNVYMPAYGSRITSAVYIRGIGSRTNTPAVGLYVDNVPYTDKSAYDFSFSGVERVDVLRGPQGTLYGRNTMGGLVRVFTADPISHSGTELSAGWTSRTGGRRASFTTYVHPAQQMGFSLNAYYDGQNGFFRNACTGRHQDGSDAGGARLRWAWRPTDVVRLDWTVSYEQSNEAACPYYLLGRSGNGSFIPSSEGEALEQNRPSSYRRKLLSTGLGVEHRLPRVTLTSITSWQHLTDRLFMDQDFTRADIFSLEQRQRMDAATEEIAIKSPAGSQRRWEWTTGAFAMYQHLRTDCPVTFYRDGISMLNSQLSAVMPAQPAIAVSFTGSELPFDARLVTPSVNTAVFHQSTINDLLVDGLSLTLGLRLDYDAHRLRLTSPSRAIPYYLNMAMGMGMNFDTDLEADAAIDGHTSYDSWQVLPKAALSYRLPDGLGNIYASVSKGYRSGGYNIQSYSELSQAALRNSMLQGVKEYSTNTINALPLPDARKQQIIASMGNMIDAQLLPTPDVRQLHYKPEYTWSYETGIHHNLAGRTLQVDLSGFLMTTHDQQVARFAATGLGRVTANAGRSRSIGAEATVRSVLASERLELSATYGYTHATFTRYDGGEGADYTGNRVPFVPRHTFSTAADFRQPLRTKVLKAIAAGADLRGAGSVVWDEANTFEQPVYATLGTRLAIELAGGVSIEAWGRNLTGTRYAAFSFESMGRRYAQYGQPRHFGIDVKWKL